MRLFEIGLKTYVGGKLHAKIKLKECEDPSRAHPTLSRCQETQEIVRRKNYIELPDTPHMEIFRQKGNKLLIISHVRDRNDSWKQVEFWTGIHANDTFLWRLPPGTVENGQINSSKIKHKIDGWRRALARRTYHSKYLKAGFLECMGLPISMYEFESTLRAVLGDRSPQFQSVEALKLDDYHTLIDGGIMREYNLDGVTVDLIQGQVQFGNQTKSTNGLAVLLPRTLRPVEKEGINAIDGIWKETNRTHEWSQNLILSCG